MVLIKNQNHLFFSQKIIIKFTKFYALHIRSDMHTLVNNVRISNGLMDHMKNVSYILFSWDFQFRTVCLHSLSLHTDKHTHINAIAWTA